MGPELRAHNMTQELCQVPKLGSLLMIETRRASLQHFPENRTKIKDPITINFKN